MVMTGIGKSMKSHLSWIKHSLFAVVFITLFGVAAVPWNKGVVRPDRDEKAARCALRNIAEAQDRFQALAAVDADGDGIGEYGYFAELADRSSSVDLEYPLLPMRFTDVDENGCVESIGYYFRMYVGSELIPEAPGGGRDAPARDDSAENYWMCYAWPVSKAEGRSKAFSCSKDGIVMQSVDYELRGSKAEPVSGSWTPCK